MPLKEIKEPPAGKGKEKEKKPKPSEKPDGDDSAWKYLEDGSKKRKGRKLPYEAQIHELFDEIAGAVQLVDSFSSQVISARSEELAYGYARLAKEDPRIRAFFAKALMGSAYSAVILPTALTLVPILWHFGLVPAKIGVPLTLMSGQMPVTRTQEQEWLASQQAEQAQAAAAEKPTHPQGEGSGDGGSTD